MTTPDPPVAAAGFEAAWAAFWNVRRNDETLRTLTSATTKDTARHFWNSALAARPAALREGDENAGDDTDDNWTVTIAERESFERIAAEIAARPAPAAAAEGAKIECERALLDELATWTLPPEDTWTWGFNEGFRKGWAARPAPAAAPAAAERADPFDRLEAVLVTRHNGTLGCWTCYAAGERLNFTHKPDCPLVGVLAARPAALREGGVVGAVLRELEWRHWSTRDGDGRMCLVCERDESRGHAPDCRMAAAIEAARGGVNP